MSLNQEQTMTLRAAEGLARRERWPAGLLPAVQRAVTDADPIGPDAWRGQGARWEAIADALLDVAVERPTDAQRLSQLLIIAQGGATIDDSPVTAVTTAAGDFASGVAADVRGGVAAVPDVLDQSANLAKWVAVGALAVGAWYYLAGPGSRGR